MILSYVGHAPTAPSSRLSIAAPLRVGTGDRRVGLRRVGTASRALVAGSFVDLPGEASSERRQYCHSQVLALIKRRTLARLRKGVEPVEQVAFARFLAEWQGVGKSGRGVDAVLGPSNSSPAIRLPASAVESMILPARVADYSPSMLDELTASGEIYWIGDGPIGDSDGWSALVRRGSGTARSPR